MKKGLFLFLFVFFLVVSGCSNNDSKLSKDNETNNKTDSINKVSTKKTIPAFQSTKQVGYENSLQIKKKINDKLIITATGWSEESNGNAYIEFHSFDNGKWNSKTLHFVKDSTQFNPKFIEILTVTENTKIALVMNKDTARGYIGSVSIFLIKDGNTITHIEDYSKGSYLLDKLKKLDKKDLEFLQQNGILPSSIGNEAVMFTWNDNGLIVAYDKKLDIVITKEVKDIKTRADVLLGENNYAGVYLNDSGLGISSLVGKFEDRTIDEVTNLEKIVVNSGSNLVFINESTYFSIYSDLGNPGTFYNNNYGTSMATLLKENVIYDISPGIYTFVIENYDLEQQYAFEVHVK